MSLTGFASENERAGRELTREEAFSAVGSASEALQSSQGGQQNPETETVSSLRVLRASVVKNLLPRSARDAASPDALHEER